MSENGGGNDEKDTVFSAAVGLFVMLPVGYMFGILSDKADEITVKPLVGNGRSSVRRDTFLGKEILSIPGIGEWAWKALQHRKFIVAAAIVLLIIGCIPKGKKRQIDAQV